MEAYNRPLPLDFSIIHALENDLAGLLELEEIFLEATVSRRLA